MQIVESIKNNSISASENETLMGTLIHACDISNVGLPIEEFKRWGLRISQEFDDTFAMETDLVARLGSDTASGVSPPMPFLKYQDLVSFNKSQIGFSRKFLSLL